MHNRNVEDCLSLNVKSLLHANVQDAHESSSKTLSCWKPMLDLVLVHTCCLSSILRLTSVSLSSFSSFAAAVSFASPSIRTLLCPDTTSACMFAVVSPGQTLISLPGRVVSSTTLVKVGPCCMSTWPQVSDPCTGLPT